MENKIFKPNFDEKEHVYTDEKGNVIPSVTQILKSLGIVKDLPNMKHITDAATRGNAVHKVLELYSKGIKGEELAIQFNAWAKKFDIRVSLDEVKKFAAGGIKFLEENNDFRITGSEKRLSGFGYAGTIDLTAFEDSFECVLDWKTTSKIQDSSYLQLAGYRKLQNAKNAFIIWLKDDGAYEVHKMPEFYKKAWDKCLELYLDETISDKNKQIEARKLFKNEIDLPPAIAKKFETATTAKKEAETELKEVRKEVEEKLLCNGIKRNGVFTDENGAGFSYSYSDDVVKDVTDYKAVVESLNMDLIKLNGPNMVLSIPTISTLLHTYIDENTTSKVTKKGSYTRRTLKGK